MKMNVALLRVSTDMQEFNAQKVEIENYCLKNKIYIDKVIEEFNVSGYSTALEDRKGLMEIKELATKGLIDKLIIFNLDRIGRSMELTIYLNFLTNAGVTIVSVTEGIIGNNSMDDKLLNSIKLWLAESESVKISVRSRAGLMAKNKRGEYAGGDINYGYYLDADNNIKVNKEEAKIVEWIFNRYLEVGTITIARELNKKGVEKYSKGKKVEWKQTAVARILKNHIYIGRKEYGKTEETSADKTNKNRRINLNKMQLQDYKKELQIINNDLFNRVNVLLKERGKERGKYSRGTTRSKELLEGLVYHSCGRKMYINYIYYKDIKRPTFKCKHCTEQKTKGVQKSISSYVLDNSVENSIKNIFPKLDKNKLLEHIQQIDNNNNLDLNSSIKTIKENIKRHEKIYENATKELDKIFAGESSLTTDIVSVKMNESKNKIIELKQKLLENETKKDQNTIFDIDKLLELYVSFIDIYNIASIEKKKALLNEIIEKVIFYNPDKIDVMFKHLNF